jgi:hypothetical protein
VFYRNDLFASTVRKEAVFIDKQEDNKEYNIYVSEEKSIKNVGFGE